MRQEKKLSYDMFWSGLAAPKDEVDREYCKLTAALRRAIESELTPAQKQCIEKRFIEKKTVTEAARELGVCPSTVTRHIQRGSARLRRVLSYAFPRFQ